MDEMHSGVRRMPLLGAILVLLLVLAGASLYYALQNQAAGGVGTERTSGTLPRSGVNAGRRLRCSRRRSGCVCSSE